MRRRHSLFSPVADPSCTEGHTENALGALRLLTFVVSFSVLGTTFEAAFRQECGGGRGTSAPRRGCQSRPQRGWKEESDQDLSPNCPHRLCGCGQLPRPLWAPLSASAQEGSPQGFHAPRAAPATSPGSLEHAAQKHWCLFLKQNLPEIIICSRGFLLIRLLKLGKDLFCGWRGVLELRLKAVWLLGRAESAWLGGCPSGILFPAAHPGLQNIW